MPELFNEVSLVVVTMFISHGCSVYFPCCGLNIIQNITEPPDTLVIFWSKPYLFFEIIDKMFAGITEFTGQC